MKFNELEAKIREIIPEADLQFDNDGQIVIYTNLALADEDLVEQYMVASK